MSIDIIDIQNRRKIIDMMTSMHSSLYDRYKKLSRLIDCILIVVSIILLTFTFIDPNIVVYYGFDDFTIKLVIGLSSILMTALSFISFIVDWKNKATYHDQAFRSLLALKTEWRLLETDAESISDTEYRNIETKTSLIMSQMIPISDNDFNRLKAKHYKKVIISKIISDHPGSSIVLIKLKMKISDTKKSIKYLEQLENGQSR